MTDAATRVSRCFAIVFPSLSQADIQLANQEALAQWDSLGHITLLSAIAEEFQCELDDEFLEALTSYEKIVAYVETLDQ